MENKEFIKKRIDFLPEELKKFILDGIWQIRLRDTCNDFGFDEEECVLAENEVFLVLLGFEPANDLKENLKKVLNIDSNMTDYLFGEIQNKILNQNESYIDGLWQKIESLENNLSDLEFETNIEEKTPPKPNSTGKSFEETILNQARAMMPKEFTGRLKKKRRK